jgi:hypothetical protein
MAQTVDLDDLITNKEAASLLKIRPNTLEIWRHQGRGPEYLKLGDAANATVRYLRSEVVKWAAEQAYRSTSAHAASVREKHQNLMRIAPAAPGAVTRPWETAKPASSGSGAAS